MERSDMISSIGITQGRREREGWGVRCWDERRLTGEIYKKGGQIVKIRELKVV